MITLSESASKELASFFASHDDDELTAWLSLGEMGYQLMQGAAYALFVHLRNLAAG